ncbi:unnamed protein product [Microthlaspi erraticum]|uniref:Uncharacterized protein n=1 Tax=Microthlaspi erraticum TaxID=1685480 RepID=A0A6D2KCU7_9BRAS|nr:unnamed protein product [Microthlaspi erraticum]
MEHNNAVLQEEASSPMRQGKREKERAEMVVAWVLYWLRYSEVAIMLFNFGCVRLRNLAEEKWAPPAKMNAGV